MSMSLGSLGDAAAEPDGPIGYSYSAVLVRTGERPAGHGEVLGTLQRLRFSGWLAPEEAGWSVAVAESRTATVASGRRGIVGVGEALAIADPGSAAPVPPSVLAVRVLGDRQLVLVAWADGEEVARYVSDPSREPGAPEDVMDDPVGDEDAEAIATACGRPDAGEELTELLAEPLDPDEEIESERLGRVLALLVLPTWLVTAWRLPREMPLGPSPKAMTHLRAGRAGPTGWAPGRVATVVRRWRPPPPVLDDPPRRPPGMDDPYLYL